MEFPPENFYAHTKKLRYIINQLDALQACLGRPIKILDFGCGNGTTVSTYLIQRGYTYLGVDMHAPSLEYASRHFSSEHATFLSEVPEGECFDAIVYADVLEHLDDPLALLKQHAQLLSDHGLIVASVPNGYGPYENEMRLVRSPICSKAFFQLGRFRRFVLRQQADTGNGMSGDTVPYNYDSGHVQFYSRRALRKLMAQSGFKINSFEKGSLLCGPLSHRFFLKGQKIMDLNIRLGEFLPYWAVSTWYFTAHKRP